MKIIIAGGRYFDDYHKLQTSCAKILANQVNIEIVSGCASGADMLGERFAEENGYKLTKFPADWKKHGKSAGPMRNLEMAKYSDALICFWDGKSKGTENMIKQARKEELLIRVVRY